MANEAGPSTRQFIDPAPIPAFFPHGFQHLRLHFHAEQLPSLPKLKAHYLEAINCIDRNQAPNRKTLALEGDALMSYHVIQAIANYAPHLDNGKITLVKSHLVSNVTFSHLTLCYNLIPSSESPKQKAYGDIFEAYIGGLYREARERGAQGDMEAWLIALFSPDVWPILRDLKNGKSDLEWLKQAVPSVSKGKDPRYSTGTADDPIDIEEDDEDGSPTPAVTAGFDSDDYEDDFEIVMGHPTAEASSRESSTGSAPHEPAAVSGQPVPLREGGTGDDWMRDIMHSSANIFVGEGVRVYTVDAGDDPPPPPLCLEL